MNAPVLRLAAFADGDRGGNPAGVLIDAAHPADAEMARIAAELGYSETAFARPDGAAWRVRYFSPESEVPFCGHATIALGAVLARDFGNGVYTLRLNQAEISVEGHFENGEMSAALQSPPTRSAALDAGLADEVLELFGYGHGQLDARIPPARIHGGADHLVFALESRAALAAMSYDLDRGRELMRREDLVTIMLVFAESERLFHSRNPFASGGVYEDPATGALSGYLRDLGWPHGGSIDIVQGEDMGARSLLHADIPPAPGSSIRVSGSARLIEP